MLPDEFRIIKVEAWPVVLPLREPFVVATGSMTAAHNVFVRIQLHNGAYGFGEMAPFPDISGEDQPGCLAALPFAAENLLGQSVVYWRRLAYELSQNTMEVPAVRCGLETALVDALCRGMGLPLWALWGGADVRQRQTDVTLPIGETAQVVETAKRWFDRGFRVFKMKVGQDVETDIQRVVAVYQVLPTASFVIDANQGFTADQTLSFLGAVHRLQIPVLLLEQPVHREDREALIYVHQHSAIPIAADESLRSLSDAEQLIREQAVDVFNIKITKCGVMESVNIINLARAAGLRLMIGGMVESRVAMGCSFSLVLGLGGFEFIDLDMPLLLDQDPIAGGYRYEGHSLLPWETPGLGQEFFSDSGPTMVIQ